MQSVCSKPTQVDWQSNQQAACSGMNQMALSDSQDSSIFQMLPEDETKRKLLIDRIIHQHNVSCSVPANKIATVKPSFSSSYPKLATWIKNTFSDLSTDGMHLIAFALGHFAQYHDLVTSGAATPPNANTQVIEDWFQSYGTKLCSDALTELSYLMNETEKFQFFQRDVSKFCSRVTPEAINRAAFEPVSGIRALNRDVAKCYCASTAVFARLYLSEDSTIGFNCNYVISCFGLTMGETFTTRARFQDPFRAIMATMDDFIRSKASQTHLHLELVKHIKKWSRYDRHEGIKSFQEALGKIDEMQASKAKKASLQPMGLKSMERTGSSSMARKTPASPKPREEVDTYELC